MVLDILYYLVKVAECHRYIAVGTAIIKCDLSALRIVNGSAGEAYIGNESSLLIPLFGSEKEILASVKNL
jgi:hypothetical protein